MQKLKFVYSDALGWRVQAQLVKKIAADRTDNIEIELVPYSVPKFARILLKDIYGTGLPKRMSLCTSIRIASSSLCKNLTEFKADSNVVFLGGNALGLISHAPKEVKPVLITDMTADLARKLFRARFNNRDVKEERVLLTKCRKIFAMSTSCVNSLINDYGIDQDKVELYLPPVLIGANTRKSDNDKLRIGFVGGDFKRKGGDLLISAFRRSKMRSRMELVVVSSSYESAPEDGIISFKGLPHGQILTEILPTLDIFCLPTTQDCSGIAVAEALSAGIPVVATNIPGLSDLVINNYTGITVPLNDVAALVEAIEWLGASSDIRNRFSTQARQFAFENFDMNKKMNKIIDAFRQ